VAITTESGETYFANGVCQCKAYALGTPCKHRAAVRIIEMYNEAITTVASEPTDEPTDERIELIADITSTWSRKFRGESLADALMFRSGCNHLSALAPGRLRDILAIIAKGGSRNDGTLRVTPIESKLPQPAARFTVTASIDGFPVTVEVEGRADDLRA